MHRLFVGLELTPKVTPLALCIFIAFLTNYLKCGRLPSAPARSGKDFRSVPDYVTSTISKEGEVRRTGDSFR